MQNSKVYSTASWSAVIVLHSIALDFQVLDFLKLSHVIVVCAQPDDFRLHVMFT